MKKDNWFKRHPIWTGIIVVLILLSVIGSFIPDDDLSNNNSDIESSLTDSQKESIIKKAVEYELNEYWGLLNTDPICYEYVLEDDWLRLRCDKDLTKSGMELVVKRIQDNIEQDTSEPLTLNIAFKDYDYNTLEIFTIKT